MAKADVDVAVLLAAGRGSRLAPHTDTVPKPLLPVNNRPTLHYILESVRACDIDRVVLVTHYLSEQIEDFADLYAREHSLDIRCIRQPRLAGTADALECVIDHVPAGWLTGSLLLSATDYILTRNFFPDLLTFHRSHDKAISVSLKRLGSAQAMRSSVRFDADNNITEIVEKPEPGSAPSDSTANLTYILPAQLLPLLQHTKPSARGEREVQSAINTYLELHGPAAGLQQSVPAEWEPG